MQNHSSIIFSRKKKCYACFPIQIHIHSAFVDWFYTRINNYWIHLLGGWVYETLAIYRITLWIILNISLFLCLWLASIVWKICHTLQNTCVSTNIFTFFTHMHQFNINIFIFDIIILYLAVFTFEGSWCERYL